MQDVVASMKGPHYRLVGRHTQRFLDRAAKQAKNEIQRKVLFIAAAGVDDAFSRVFSVSLSTANSFRKIPLEGYLSRRQINTAFRAYLSMLLIVLGGNKAQLLEKAGLSEAEWLALWRRVFEYQDEDLGQFDQCLLPVYQSQGFAGLCAATALYIETVLSGASGQLKCDQAILENSVKQDVFAIMRLLNPVREA
ncbi:MAG: hypothetical protein N2491_07200 [Negativicutes bacterium]|nr:hypothetical protein [Negativicutes bacterium]